MFIPMWFIVFALFLFASNDPGKFIVDLVRLPFRILAVFLCGLAPLFRFLGDVLSFLMLPFQYLGRLPWPRNVNVKIPHDQVAVTGEGIAKVFWAICILSVVFVPLVIVFAPH